MYLESALKHLGRAESGRYDTNGRDRGAGSWGSLRESHVYVCAYIGIFPQ